MMAKARDDRVIKFRIDFTSATRQNIQVFLANIISAFFALHTHHLLISDWISLS
jgi:hypothetical protein